jgi:hypothetical protein
MRGRRTNRRNHDVDDDSEVGGYERVTAEVNVGTKGSREDSAVKRPVQLRNVRWKMFCHLWCRLRQRGQSG